MLWRIGQALFGSRHWGSELALALHVGDRRVRAWAAAERPVPPGVWRDLNYLMQQRCERLARLVVELADWNEPEPEPPPAGLASSLHELGLTQTELAYDLGVNITTVNRWLHGRVPVPLHVIAYLELRRRLQRYETLSRC